jgi:hypothetical protein
LAPASRTASLEAGDTIVEGEATAARRAKWVWTYVKRGSPSWGHRRESLTNARERLLVKTTYSRFSAAPLLECWLRRIEEKASRFSAGRMSKKRRVDDVKCGSSLCNGRESCR